jgi:hypothetical protein
MEEFKTVPFERAGFDDGTAPEPRGKVLRARPEAEVTDLASARSAHPRTARRASAPPPSPVTATAPGTPDWSAYERIGLGPPKSELSKRAAKLVVSTYRLLGFGILTLIIAVLVGYVVTTAYYFLSHSWLTPTIVLGTDERVVALRTELAALENQRDHTAADLHDAERTIAVELSFQLAFVRATRADLDARKAALQRVRTLVDAASSTRQRIRSSTSAYAKQFADRTRAEYEAGVINRNAMLSGDYQLAEISSSNLSVAEREAALQNQADELATEARSLDALLADDVGAALSHEVLKIKRDYDASKLALAKATEARDTLAAALARQEEAVQALRQSNYLRALADQAAVALVPYANLDHVQPGTKLYACRVGILWCHAAGEVRFAMPGEVQFKHPHNDTLVRGQMLELRLTDPSAAQEDVLFAGGRPLWP